MADSGSILGLGYVDENGDKQERTGVYYPRYFSDLPFWRQRSEHERVFPRIVFQETHIEHGAERKV